MELNVYSLLVDAQKVARTSDASIFGVEIAIVTNLQDPEQQGRVKVCFPRMPGKPESGWARVAQPAAGPGRGFYWLPLVGDEVLVAFERGATNRPYVIGCLWNGKDAPMKDAFTSDNTVRMIQSQSGHRIVLDDGEGKEKIVIADKSGKRTLTFDVTAKKLVIEAGEGDVCVSAAKKIVLDCEDLEIKTKKTGKLDIGTTFDLTAKGKAQFKAGPVLNIKASQVHLNPDSGGGGGGGGGGAAAGAAAAARAAVAAAASSKAGGAAGARAGAGGAMGGGGGVAGFPSTAGLGGGPNLATDLEDTGAQAAKGAGGAGANGGAAGAAADGKSAQTTQTADAAAANAGAATPTAANEVSVQLVDPSGAPKANLEVEITLPDGSKRAGQTDAQGNFKVQEVSASGTAKLSLPDVPAVSEGAAAEGRVRYAPPQVDVTVGKAAVIEVPPVVRRCRLQGLHFETNKTFLLPSAMAGMRQLVKIFNSFKNLVTLVNGHTDKQGTPSYNLGLSRDRADAIEAFLLDDADAWQKFYKGTPTSAAWGLREDQFMLSTVQDKDGAPFYTGAVDGQDGPLTQQAYKSFQHSRLITETGKPDDETRLELARAYMALEGTSLPKGSPIETHGCGQTHPLPETEGDSNPDQPKNRRVEIFLFDAKVDPAAKNPCPTAGCEEYPKWVAQKTLDVDLDQPPGALTVVVTDDAGNPIEKAAVHLAGPIAQDGQTDDQGSTQFTDIPAGSYKVIAEKDGFTAADTTTDVKSGGAPAPAPKADAKGLVAFAGTTAPTGGVLLKLGKAAKLEVVVQLKTIFTLAGAPATPRWNSAPFGLLGGALVSIDTGTPVKTDATGKAKVDITALAPGKHALNVEPDPKKKCTIPAGPLLGSGAATDPDVMYRAFSLDIETDPSGVIKVNPPPAGVTSFGARTINLSSHFLLLSFKALEVVVDWKFDWFKTKHQLALPTRTPKVLVVHQTAGVFGGDLDTLVTTGPGSAHYLVDVDGHAVKLAHEKVDTAHVGGDKWMGIGHLPDVSVGIEQSHTDAGGLKPYPDDQVFRTEQLVAQIRSVHGTILRQAVAGHGEVEFGARGIGDPGPTFEWKMLEDGGQARTRILTTPIPAKIYGIGPGDPPIKAGAKPSAEIGELQQDLKTIGYDFTFKKNSYDGGTITAVRRFQVRFWSGSLRAPQAWSAGRAFALNEGAVNGGNFYVCTKAGISDAAGTGPSGTGSALIVDGTAKWLFSHVDLGPRPTLDQVDFATAKAIKQVLADAPASVTVTGTPGAPGGGSSGGGGATKSDFVDEAAPATSLADQGPGGPGEAVPFKDNPVVHDGDEVTISWNAKGDFDKLVLDPGGIDISGASGSKAVVARRADAEDGAVPFQVSAFLGDAPDKSDTAVGGAIAEGAVAIGRLLMDLTPLLSPLANHCIAARSDPAMTGTAFMASVAGVKTAADRDKEIVKQVLAGNVPDFLRAFVAVRVSNGSDTGTFFCAPDYLCIGTDADFVRVPLLPANAQKVVDGTCCILPTTRMVDVIFGAATARLDPMAVPNIPGVQNKEVIDSNKRCQTELAKIAGYKLGDLTTGPKKDIVLSLFLKKLSLKGTLIGGGPHRHQSNDAVVIYGWHQIHAAGVPLQGEFDGHDKNYEDYSHGIRLISKQMLVNGSMKDVADVLKDKSLAPLICKAADVADAAFPIDPRYP